MTTESVPMPWIKPRYLWEDKDRHDNVRRYVKKGDGPKIRIYPEPDTKEFWEAYTLALDGVSLPKTARVEPIKPATMGTLQWLVQHYQASADFLGLNLTTKSARRSILASCCDEPIDRENPGLVMGAIPITRITAAHVRAWRDRKRELPEAANGRVKALRGLFKWTMAQDDLARRFGLTINPARDVPLMKGSVDGFHTWTPEEVEQYEAYHAPGTPARLALALLLFTGQRRSDVIRFGRQHITEQTDQETGRKVRWLHFTQRKNRDHKAVTLDLPVLDLLQAAIDLVPRTQLTFLITSFGKPFSDAGFGNRMRKWCDAAGLPHCSAHGLRKAGACIAAENGATEAQMMAIFGWSDPRMAAKYARKARQKKIAGQSMHLMVSKRRKRSDEALPLMDWSEKSGRIG